MGRCNGRVISNIAETEREQTALSCAGKLQKGGGIWPRSAFLKNEEIFRQKRELVFQKMRWHEWSEGCIWELGNNLVWPDLEVKGEWPQMVLKSRLQLLSERVCRVLIKWLVHYSLVGSKGVFQRLVVGDWMEGSQLAGDQNSGV